MPAPAIMHEKTATPIFAEVSDCKRDGRKLSWPSEARHGEVLVVVFMSASRLSLNQPALAVEMGMKYFHLCSPLLPVVPSKPSPPGAGCQHLLCHDVDITSVVAGRYSPPAIHASTVAVHYWQRCSEVFPLLVSSRFSSFSMQR